MLKKLIRNHQWITLPDKNNISYFGLTQFSKDYLLRLDSLNHQHNFKTRYGILNKTRITNYLNNLVDKYQIGKDVKNVNNDQNTGNKNENNNNNDINKIISMKDHIDKFCLAEQIQYDRFAIKKDQHFSTLHTVQFDVQLTAPIQMRVLECNYQTEYFAKVYDVQWLYKVQILDYGAIGELMTQEQYQKIGKIIPYQGMLL